MTSPKTATVKVVPRADDHSAKQGWIANQLFLSEVYSELAAFAPPLCPDQAAIDDIIRALAKLGYVEIEKDEQ